MAAQPFHRMAPVPPHLTYKPEVSTYMDHFKNPVQAPRRRPVMPPQMLLKPRGQSATQNRGGFKENSFPSAVTRQAVSSVKAKRAQPKVKDYMDQLLKMTEKDYPSHNARVDVPFKDAQPNAKQRNDLRRINRAGFGIPDSEAREIARKDRSVDFYLQHKVQASDPNPSRVKSAPMHKMSITNTNKKSNNNVEAHWMTWNSGTLEPPGLQKRLHRPWPTPEPPRIDRVPLSRNSVRHSAGFRRPATGTLLPSNPSMPVPDMIGSEGMPPTLNSASEVAFSPKPPALPSSERVGKVVGGYPLAYLF